MHFRPFFFGPPGKSGLQPARHEPFTKDAKIRCLYDTVVFESGALAGDFPCNLLKRNSIGAKMGRPGNRPNRVTYNNMLFAKPEKWGFLRASGNRRPAGGATLPRLGRPSALTLPFPTRRH
jgi:hypothetical protein